MNRAASACSHIAAARRSGQKQIFANRVQKDVVGAGGDLTFVPIYPKTNNGPRGGLGLLGKRERPPKWKDLRHLRLSALESKENHAEISKGGYTRVPARARVPDGSPGPIPPE